MTQEEYVTFNQAKELKELGFETKWTYNSNEPNTIPYGDKESGIAYHYCPTLSLVQKWLREEKDLIIDVGVMSKKVALVSLFQFTKHGITPILHMKSSDDYSSYEEALSAGIDECIKLLKEK